MREEFWAALPDPNKRVTIRPNGQIRLNIQGTNLEGHKRLTQNFEAMLTDTRSSKDQARTELRVGSVVFDGILTVLLIP
jgi:hypothetical protein